jgi:hypothetical protein
MQFALLNLRITVKLLRHGNATKTIPTSAPGGHTTRRSSKPASTSVAIHFNLRRLEPQCDLRMESGAYRMAPFADAKEQLGGFTILELPSLDAALEWAARCPAASIGAVEVRPVSPEYLRRVTG